jgi:hypothetical protein
LTVVTVWVGGAAMAVAPAAAKVSSVAAQIQDQRRVGPVAQRLTRPARLAHVDLDEKGKCLDSSKVSAPSTAAGADSVVCRAAAQGR